MTRYAVVLSDLAEDDIDRETFRLMGVVGTERAIRWQAAVLEAIQDLSLWPRRHSIAEHDAPAFPRSEVRRVLVGKGRAVYKVLFHVIDPAEGETEGVVRVLRVRHAAMRPLGQPEDQE